MNNGRCILKSMFLGLAFLTWVHCNTNSHPDYYGTVRPLHPPDELWLDSTSEPATLDPAKSNDNFSYGYVSEMFVRLTQMHAVTGEIIPDLAARWTLSPDGLKYTFYLRKDAKWSDGQPLTARDVEWSWKRLMDPKTGATYSQFTEVIQELVVVDDATLLVKLKHPVPYFLSLIEYPAFAPVPRHLIERLTLSGKEDEWTKPENIAVSGPFTLVKEKFKQYKIFEKNPLFYESEKIRINKVKVIMVENQRSSLHAYKTGQYDFSFTASIPPEEVLRLKRFKDLFQDPFFSIYYYELNVSVPPLDQVKVRRSLSLAIDREQIATSVMRGNAQPTSRFVPDGIPGYVPSKSKDFDVNLARRLLSEAGFPNGQNFPKLTLKFNTSESHKAIAEAIQDMWKRHLGIVVNLENKEWSVVLNDLHSKKFDLIRHSWTGDYFDPHAFLERFISNSRSNFSGWSRKAFDLVVSHSNMIQDRDVRMKKLLEAEAMLAAEVPVIPIFSSNKTYLKKPYLKGFWPNHRHKHPWKFMWIDQRWYKEVPANPEDFGQTDKLWAE